MFDPPLRGRCRACHTTDPDTGWSDRKHNHCRRCYCADCGRKFLSSAQYHVDREWGLKVCRARKRCATDRAIRCEHRDLVVELWERGETRKPPTHDRLIAVCISRAVAELIAMNHRYLPRNSFKMTVAAPVWSKEFPL